MWEQEFLDELCEYLGFTAAHAAQLSAMRSYVEPAFDGIVERFYEAVQRNARASAVFTGGKPQIERQKQMLRAWLLGVFSGVYDVEYLRVRARIGRTHVNVRLDQRYMFAAMSIVREGLHAALRASAYPVEHKPFAHASIDKICDLELAIMLQTYSEHYHVRIRDSERLATLGQLAGFIGHELRNPLAVMETSLHLLKSRLATDDERVQKHLRRLGEQVQTAGGIISDLLELARDRPMERASVEVRPMLEAALRGLTFESERLQMRVEVPEGMPPARLDEKQVQRIVVNLATNAAQAMEANVREPRFVVEARREDDSLLLIASDNGPGISEEVRHRLFEPLATTRVKGLGLGLAMCRRIAEKHGGEIRAHNKPEGGALFEVRLAGAFPP